MLFTPPPPNKHMQTIHTEADDLERAGRVAPLTALSARLMFCCAGDRMAQAKMVDLADWRDSGIARHGGGVSLYMGSRSHSRREKGRRGGVAPTWMESASASAW